MNIFRRLADAVKSVARKVVRSISGFIQSFHSGKVRELFSNEGPMRKAASDSALLKQRAKWFSNNRDDASSAVVASGVEVREPCDSIASVSPADSVLTRDDALGAPTTPIAGSSGLEQFSFASRSRSPSEMSDYSENSCGEADLDLSRSELDDEGNVLMPKLACSPLVEAPGVTAGRIRSMASASHARLCSVVAVPPAKDYDRYSSEYEEHCEYFKEITKGHSASFAA